MHQQHLLAAQLDHAGVGQQGAAGGFAEGLADQEVAVAVHQVNGRAAVAQPRRAWQIDCWNGVMASSPIHASKKSPRMYSALACGRGRRADPETPG
jgi:hypothetical protein